MVLDEICVAPTGRLSIIPSSPNTMLSTASSFASMVITASLRQTSDTLATALAPCATSLAAFVRFRLYTLTSWPAFSRLAAMPAPICPNPMNPIFMTILLCCCALVFSRLSLRRYVRAQRRSRIRCRRRGDGRPYIEPMRQKAKRERDSGQSHGDPRQLAIGQTVGQGETADPGACRVPERSEEHTSELQSRSDLVCRLLLEKKKK